METYSSISFDLLEIGISLENKSARFEPLRIPLEIRIKKLLLDFRFFFSFNIKLRHVQQTILNWFLH